MKWFHIVSGEQYYDILRHMIIVPDPVPAGILDGINWDDGMMLIDVPEIASASAVALN